MRFWRTGLLWFIALLVVLSCSAWSSYAQQAAPLVVPFPGPRIAPVPGIEFTVRNNFLRTSLSLAPKGGPSEISVTDVFNLDRSTGFTQLSANIPFRDCRFAYSYDARRDFSGQGYPTEFTFAGKGFGQKTTSGSTTDTSEVKLTSADLSLNSHRFDADLPPSPLFGFAVRPSASWLITNTRLSLASNGTRVAERKTGQLFGLGAAFTTVYPMTRIQGRATYWFGNSPGYSADVGASLATSLWWNRITSIMVGYRVERVNFGLGSGDIRVDAQGPWVGMTVLF